MTTAQHEARFPAPDDALSRAGVLQCRRGTLSPPPGGLLLSPSRAARETATELGWHQAPEEPLLSDQHVGVWQGRALEELNLPDIVSWRAGAAPPEGESRNAQMRRVEEFLRRLGPGPTIAIVPQTVLRCAMVIALGGADEAFWRIDAEPLSTLRLRRRARDQYSIHLTPRPVFYA
ncbi:histidine phosphatase family protein [Microbacterium oleivorans]|uniref:Histidine phosphatase family protein n=1 Tax=Microbacterium oleivorans TaxID=273677 RepID=A0A7D5JGQ8_9MICO|nr:histidine phosphatase family protein [Microbacterium oleivorans]QLD12778.1 histidine phosphatase family protein [Microbacterium oleivorans]